MKPLLPSDLYAISQNAKNEGSYECHWCSGDCRNLWIHDDPPPIPFSRSKSSAKRVANPYVCMGCWLWRRNRLCVNYLTEPDKPAMKDGQAPSKHSWWITNESALVVDAESPLIEKLLAPPLRFVLSLVDPGTSNHIHLATVNDHVIIKADTILRFTFNNQGQEYTIYELRDAIQQKTAAGKSPGVATILRLFQPPAHMLEKRGRGRPPEDERNNLKKMIAASGQTIPA